MTLLTMIMVGRSCSALNASSAWPARRVVGIVDPLNSPAVALETLGDVLGEGEIGAALDRDLVARRRSSTGWTASGGQRDEAASAPMPSIRQPSPAIAYTS